MYSHRVLDRARGTLRSHMMRNAISSLFSLFSHTNKHTYFVDVIVFISPRTSREKSSCLSFLSRRGVTITCLIRLSARACLAPSSRLQRIASVRRGLAYHFRAWIGYKPVSLRVRRISAVFRQDVSHPAPGVKGRHTRVRRHQARLGCR
jgi:hypothetical protein